MQLLQSKLSEIIVRPRFLGVSLTELKGYTLSKHAEIDVEPAPQISRSEVSPHS